MLLREGKLNRQRLLIVSLITIISLLSVTFIWSEARSRYARNREQKAAVQHNSFENQSHPDNSKLIEAYGRLPMSFEQNNGQKDSRVRFLSRGKGYSLFLTDDEAVMTLKPNQDQNASILRMRPLRAKPARAIEGINELPGKSNYMIGNDEKHWQLDIPNYASVIYQDIYPGIDLTYYGNQERLEYDFIVAPGGDASEIGLGFSGADKVEIDAQGNLVLTVGAQRIVQLQPTVYQQINGEKRFVNASYALKSQHEVGFQLGEYDRERELIIDPVLLYGTFLGGGASDEAHAIAVDGNGNAYITGFTSSTDFNPIVNAAQGTKNAGVDIFVTKFNISGTIPLYSTYFGGDSDDRGNGIAVDATGNAYITGLTNSLDFPHSLTAFRTQLNDGSGYHNSHDAFVTKLNASGNAFVYSTFLGGSPRCDGGPTCEDLEGEDIGYGIAVDQDSNAYIVGSTSSHAIPGTEGTDFPQQHSLQLYGNGSTENFGDAFITKLNAGGTDLLFSSFIGGAGRDEARGVAIDSNGNVYITGSTTSGDNFVHAGSFGQGFAGGSSDAFVIKLNIDNGGNGGYVFANFLGGSADDSGSDIAADAAGNCYVVGSSNSTDFPQVRSIQGNAGRLDVFVTKFNASGSAALYSTLLGGSLDDTGNSIDIDSQGNAYITGFTRSSDYPLLDAFQTQCGGCNNPVPLREAFVTKLGNNSTGTINLSYSSFLGGNFEDIGYGIAVDATGNAYVAGTTNSSDFLTFSKSAIPNVYDNVCGTDNACNQDFDAFAAKVATNSSTIQFSTNSYNVNEAGGSAVITVTRTGNSNGVVTVNYSTANGSATASQDYTAVSGTITFANGDLSPKTFSVPIINDSLDENDETVNLTLSNPTGDALLATPSTAVLTITDDDAAPTVSINNISITEGNSGVTSAVFTLTLSAASGRAITVDYATADGSTIAGSDYQAVSSSITVPANSTSANFSINVIGDTAIENDETFLVNLSNAVNATIADGQGEATIVNDDLPSISINDVSVTEGNSGTVNATFNVSLSAAINRTVTVNFATADNTATAGSDYTANSGTLTFAPNTTTPQTITVSVLGDTLNESNETFSVNLSNATNATIADAQGIGTIVSDDCATITLSPATLPNGQSGVSYSQTITANNGTAPYTITASAGLPAGFSLSTAGLLSGTTSTIGVYNFTVTATDANGCSGSRSYALVICPAQAIATNNGPLCVGQTLNLFASPNSNGNGVSYSWTGPNGFTSNLQNPSISNATTAASGSYTVTITGNGCSSVNTTTNVSVNASATLTITPTTLSNGTVGVPYSRQLTASGGNSPYTFSKISGTLPTGISLSTAGLLAGTPTVSGSFTFTVQVTGSGSCSIGTRTYTLTIGTPSCPTITLTPNSFAIGAVGAFYSQIITVNGGTAPYTFTITSGTVPPGLVLVTRSGVPISARLQGTPTAVGTYVFTITATDSQGCSGSNTYNVVIVQQQ